MLALYVTDKYSVLLIRTLNKDQANLIETKSDRNHTQTIVTTPLEMKPS